MWQQHLRGPVFEGRASSPLSPFQLPRHPVRPGTKPAGRRGDIEELGSRAVAQGDTGEHEGTRGARGTRVQEQPSSSPGDNFSVVFSLKYIQVHCYEVHNYENAFCPQSSEAWKRGC